MTKETIKRSVLKTISWHVLHFVMVGLVALLITHRIDFAALIASAELIWESIVFFLHERLWAGIRFGQRGERRKGRGHGHHGHGRH